MGRSYETAQALRLDSAASVMGLTFQLNRLSEDAQVPSDLFGHSLASAKAASA